MVNEEEFILGDSVYADNQYIQPPGTDHPLHNALANIRARQE